MLEEKPLCVLNVHSIQSLPPRAQARAAAIIHTFVDMCRWPPPPSQFNRQSSFYVGAPAARGSLRGGTENPFVLNGHSLELVPFPICFSRGNSNIALHQDSLDPPLDHYTTCLLPLPSSPLQALIHIWLRGGFRRACKHARRKWKAPPSFVFTLVSHIL